MTNRTNFDRTLQSRFSGEIVTDYGIMDGNSTILLVKAGNGGSHRGYEDKYLRLADHINRAHGWSVLCASNPQNGDKTLEGAMQIVREYAAGRGFEKFQVYYMGFSDGALIGARCGADHPEIRRMVLVNGPLMMNWHRTKAGILRFFGESATFVYGSLDPSYRYAELIRVLEKKNPRIHLEIADGQDHYFSKNGFDLAELAERYLLTTF